MKLVVTSFVIANLLFSPILSFADDSDFVEIVGPENLENFWVVKRYIKPKQNVSGRSGCVAVGFVIESSGKTSNVRVIGSFPDVGLEEAALDSIRRRRHKPAEGHVDRTPVYTTTTFMTVTSNVYENGEDVMKKVLAVCQRKERAWLAQLALGSQ